MNPEKKERLLFIGVIASMVIWGVSWSSAKVLSSYGSPATIALIRFFFVPITLIILIKALNINVKIARKGIPFVILAGLSMVVYTLLFFKGLQFGQPGKAGVLVTTTNPIIAYMIGLVVSRILPGKMEIIGLVFGMVAGIILLNVFNEPDLVFDAGNGYFLAAAVTWAIMSKFSAQANRFGNSIAFSFWMSIVVITCVLTFVDLNELTHLVKTGDTKFWLNTIFFGVVNTGLATTCYLYATAQIGAEKASTFMFIVPSMAIVGAWLFLGEQIQIHTVIGGFIGIIAVFIINGKFSKKEKA